MPLQAVRTVGADPLTGGPQGYIYFTCGTWSILPSSRPWFSPCPSRGGLPHDFGEPLACGSRTNIGPQRTGWRQPPVSPRRRAVAPDLIRPKARDDDGRQSP